MSPSVRPSLVFGVVAATGTPLDPFLEGFSALLAEYGYLPVPIRLTDLLQEHVAEPGSVTWRDEGERIGQLMNAGDLLRQRLKRGDAMALLAALGIAVRRREFDATQPCAFVVRQLKHPEEIFTLRRIYGDRFFVLSLYSTYSERLDHLTKVRGLSHEAAKCLMHRDEEDVREEGFGELGQHTRDAFELGDVFFRLDEPGCSQAIKEAQRFLDLVFGRPDLSPRADEQAMYLAYAASLRSADLSRQVGAAIINRHGDLIAVGANDVPCATGGQYWPGPDDRRDHVLRLDSNYKRKREIARDVFERTQPERSSDPAAFSGFLKALEGSLLFDITEYGRAVHAEMEALLSCVRTGAMARGARIFSTTFPCHNCAKHIVDAGIMEVQYVEAYPKSMAAPLHSDAIFWEETPRQENVPNTDQGGKVVFKHYVGVGPRRYLDLFSLQLSSGRPIKRKKDGEISLWNRANAGPRVPSETASADLEQQAINELSTKMKESP
jgi:deoxycytidylate deaminase